MKKLGFVVQVFGTIALFPIYVILEMNHGTERLPENKNHLVVKTKFEKTISEVSLHAETRDENADPGRIFMVSIAPVGMNEIIKTLVKTAYKTY